MNEVKFKANKADLEAIGGQIEEATAALDTTGATAGQVLKVETPGEAPVWGDGGEGPTPSPNYCSILTSFYGEVEWSNMPEVSMMFSNGILTGKILNESGNLSLLLAVNDGEYRLAQITKLPSFMLDPVIPLCILLWNGTSFEQPTYTPLANYAGWEYTYSGYTITFTWNNTTNDYDVSVNENIT